MNQKNVFRFISWILLVALLTAFMPGRVARAKKAVDMSKCTISLAKKSYTYTGKAIKPKITVTYKGKTLKKGTDYKVTYANNVNVGKGTVKVKGLGSYTGSVKVKFKIKEKKSWFLR